MKNIDRKFDKKRFVKRKMFKTHKNIKKNSKKMIEEAIIHILKLFYKK